MIGGLTPLLVALEQSSALNRLCLERKRVTALTIATAGAARKKVRKGVRHIARMLRLRDASFPNAKPVHVISLVG